jgi:hypothetical protein
MSRRRSRPTARLAITPSTMAIPAIPDNLKTLALDGDKAYRETYNQLYRREAEGPNQI